MQPLIVLRLDSVVWMTGSSQDNVLQTESEASYFVFVA